MHRETGKETYCERDRWVQLRIERHTQGEEGEADEQRHGRVEREIDIETGTETHSCLVRQTDVQEDRQKDREMSKKRGNEKDRRIQ